MNFFILATCFLDNVILEILRKQLDIADYLEDYLAILKWDTYFVHLYR